MITTKKLVLAGLCLASVVVLAILATPDAREWGLAAIAALLTLLLRGVDHATRGSGGVGILAVCAIGLALGACGGVDYARGGVDYARFTSSEDHLSGEVEGAVSYGPYALDFDFELELEGLALAGHVESVIYGVAVALRFDCRLRRKWCRICTEIGRLSHCWET